jgi:hypothetical protein
MLRSRGHNVHEFRLHNDAINEMSRPELIKATLWNDAVRRKIQQELATSGSQVAGLAGRVLRGAAPGRCGRADVAQLSPALPERGLLSRRLHL